MIVIPFTWTEINVLYYVGFFKYLAGEFDIIKFGGKIAVTAKTGLILLHVNINGGFW